MQTQEKQVRPLQFQLVSIIIRHDEGNTFSIHLQLRGHYEKDTY